MKTFHGGIKQKKSFGQVFLKDEWPCTKIVEILKQMKIDTVLEIGPGGAALTHKLLDAGFKVTSVEKDFRFAERLESIRTITEISNPGKFEIVNEDILKYDLDRWLDKAQGNVAVCGNIPYNISTPILELLLPRLKKLKISVLMVQKEFGERLAANPGIKNYGSLSIYAQLRSAVQLEFAVDRHCFSPVPAVDSVVISIKDKPHNHSTELLKLSEKLTRMAFSQRRKKLSNSISKLIEDIDPSILGIDLNRRAETLSPIEYINVAKILSEQLKEK